MIKLKVLLSIFLFSFVNNAYSQVVVSDPSALAQRAQSFNTKILHHGQQLVQTTATASNTLKSVQQLTEQTQQLTQQLESITGNLGLSSPLLDTINNTLSQYSELTNPLPSKMVDGRVINNKEIKDIKVLLKEINSDKSDRRRDVYEPLRQKYHADSLHDALALSEFVINNSADNIKTISNDVKSADSNQKLKDALDVTNKILLQLATTQQQQTQLLAQLVRATASKEFKGTYPTAKKREKSRMEDVEGGLNGSSFKINEYDLPFKRKGRSFTSELMGGVK